MREWYDIKDRGTMGSEKDEIKEVTILGRTVRWMAEGLEYEADAAHRRRIMEAEGLEEDSKAAPSPAVKEDNGKAELDEMDFDANEHRRFRSKGATLNYLGQDRSDIQYAVKEICQGMSRPTEGKRGSRGSPGTWSERRGWCGCTKTRRTTTRG